MKRDDIFFAAMQARDPRFDGKFFIGVKTTGIYCRPICPAKPKRENIEFFRSHFEAEKAGYRPCQRCRPESAPQSPAWIGASAVVKRAVKLLQHEDSISLDEDRFAALFGVSARHLRRLFVEELGKTPKQLSFDYRLNLARKLITETGLPLAEVAFAAGFQSIRRFNSAFKERFKNSPSSVRRSPFPVERGLRITLAYRPPFHYDSLYESYRSHRIGALEDFADGRMHRMVHLDGQVGQISIANDPERSRLLLDIDFPNSAKVHHLAARVRQLFDLDSDPVMIANSLDQDRELAALLKRHTGVRLPSGWEPFETAIATILGQLVSVEQGRRLVGDLIELLGEDANYDFRGQQPKLFPTAESIASGDLSSLRTAQKRKMTLKVFAQAVLDKKISLEPTQDVESFVQELCEIPGIGPWTAEYMALKVLRHTDAFPRTDLILSRALKIHRPEIIDKMSPWRGYVAMLLWREYAPKEKRKR